MEYRRLGRAGVQVSAVGLGGNTFGRYCDADRTAAIVRRALDLGVNHIDTADVYGQGASEELVGRAIRGRRHEVVLATKVGNPMGEGPNEQGLSRRRVVAACEASLRRLGTDYVDLYYLHRPDPSTPLEETLDAFDQLVRDGKVRYVGISNHVAWQICEALWIADRRGFHAPVVTQSHYNLLHRAEVETELLAFCRAHGVGLVPYFPLAGGVLTGKYRPGQPLQPGVRGYDNPRVQQQLTDRTFTVVGRLEEFARQHGRTVGELAIAWLLARPEVSSVIVGATRPEQVEANVAAVSWRLTAEDLQAVDRLLAV
ncbi:MAG TPA: aldo/keto reductase [Chloroflexota bacterium]